MSNSNQRFQTRPPLQSAQSRNQSRKKKSTTSRLQSIPSQLLELTSPKWQGTNPSTLTSDESPATPIPASPSAKSPSENSTYTSISPTDQLVLSCLIHGAAKSLTPSMVSVIRELKGPDRWSAISLSGLHFAPTCLDGPEIACTVREPRSAGTQFLPYTNLSSRTNAFPTSTPTSR